MDATWTDWARRYWVYLAGAAAALLVVIVLVARMVDPAPPKVVRMATGPAGGAYAAAAEALAARFAEEDVTVELVASPGSVENMTLLTRAEDPVDLAIVQGGVGMDAADGVSSLGAVFLEPLWVFVRDGLPAEDPRDLAGLTVAAGPQGSGARALLSMLLEENGVAGEVTLSPLTGAAAAEALTAGGVDAAAFVTLPNRPYVQSLLLDPRVDIMSFARADAYARRHRFLSKVVLPRGVIDPASDTPDRDVALVAPAAGLVVRAGLHPAIQSLALQTAADLFRPGDVISAPGDFPSRDLVAFALSEQAERYYERGGPGFLRRYLPFWAANLVDRLWVLAIPAATLLYPLFKTAPPLYRWQIRRRVVRWYRDLRRLEFEGRNATSNAERAHVRAELGRILSDVARVRVPLPYNDDLYRLRGHIRLVDELVAEQDGVEETL